MSSIASIRQLFPVAAAICLACGAGTSLATDRQSFASAARERTVSLESTVPARERIVLGSRSQALEQLALGLAERRPCLAITLLQLGKEDWARARNVHWPLPGLPSRRTVDLLVQRAAADEVAKSMPALGQGIYIFESLGVEVVIDSREESAHRMITTVSARLVNGDNVGQGLVEPEARIAWSRLDAQVLAIELGDEIPPALDSEAMVSQSR